MADDVNDVNDAFQRLFEELKHVYKKSVMKRKQCERVADDICLLFKPWDREKNKKISADNTVNKHSSSNHTSATCDTEYPTDAKHHSDLLVVDKLIEKAERIRLAQAKKDQALEEQENKEVQRRLMLANPPNTTSSKNSADNAKDGKITRSRAPDAHSSKQLVQRQKVEKAHKPQSGVIAQSVLDKVLPEPVSSQKPAQKPSSASSSVKYKPAHAKAPFRTEYPPVRKPMRSTTSSSYRRDFPSKQPQSAVKQSSRVDARPRKHLGGVHVTGSDKQIASSVVKGKLTSSPVSVDAAPAEELDDSAPPHQAICSLENVNEKLQALNHSDEGVNKTVMSRETVPSEKNTSQNKGETMIQYTASFELMRDGRTLRVPGKLMKLLATNRKLREKALYSTATRTAAEKPHHFFQKLQNHMDSETKYEVTAHIQMMRQQLVQYKHLIELLKQVSRHPLNENHGWQEVLSVKCRLEFVLESFADMELQFAELLKLYPPTHNNGADIKGFKNLCPTEQLHIWLPDGNILGHSVEEVLTLHGAMLYNKRADIDKWLETSYTLQHLSLQANILDHITTYLIPQFHQLQEPREKLSLYRCLYSLVSCSGRCLPAVVCSQIDSSSDTSDN